MASAAPVFSIAAYDRVAATARGIMVAKAAARGTANLDRQGASGVAARLIEDKGSRILQYLRARATQQHLLELGAAVPAEVQAQLAADVLDDCIDAVNYAIILSVYLEATT